MDKIKELLKRFSTKQIIALVISILLVVALIIFLVNKFNTDGMQQTKGVNVYYRTYTKEKGWSRWSKNGVTSGDKKHEILNLQIKVKSKTLGSVVYSIHNSDGKWQNDCDIDTKVKNKPIYGVKIAIVDTLYRKYDILYRFNRNGKWTNWYSNGFTDDEKKMIKAIDIKIIPKNADLNKSLRDYNYVQKKKGEK